MLVSYKCTCIPIFSLLSKDLSCIIIVDYSDPRERGEVEEKEGEEGEGGRGSRGRGRRGGRGREGK